MRHEQKYRITPCEAAVIRRRLQAIAAPDPHCSSGGSYRVRSLYFDTPQDTALLEKINGAAHRSKFRLRLYNGDCSVIRLEKKSRCGELCSKQGTTLTLQQTQALLAGEEQWQTSLAQPTANELALLMRTKQLRAKTLVEYTREAYIYPAGNVRVTLDSGIRTALRSTAFLDPACPTVPAPEDPIILEVKWDAFLPDIIRAAVQTDRLRSAYSKYAACRAYG